MKNKIEDLRNHLFATLEALQDESKPLDLERAKVIANVGQTIINSAMVEVKFMEATGAKGSGFIPVEPKPALTAIK
ncbi:MAG: hypothetical protein ACREUF_15435 [Solimonas sp.]